jgi:hypothetical protein
MPFKVACLCLSLRSRTPGKNVPLVPESPPGASPSWVPHRSLAGRPGEPFRPAATKLYYARRLWLDVQPSVGEALGLPLPACLKSKADKLLRVDFTRSRHVLTRCGFSASGHLQLATIAFPAVNQPASGRLAAICSTGIIGKYGAKMQPISNNPARCAEWLGATGWAGGHEPGALTLGSP